MPKKILLVDDSETVIMFETMMLRETGAEIEVARNGLEGLRKASSFHPDLIILDIVMPELDGIETCRRLKMDPNTQGIPIVMVTTKGNPEKVEEAYLAGCNDFVTKPVDKVELLSKVYSILSA